MITMERKSCRVNPFSQEPHNIVLEKVYHPTIRQIGPSVRYKTNAVKFRGDSGVLIMLQYAMSIEKICFTGSEN